MKKKNEELEEGKIVDKKKLVIIKDKKYFSQIIKVVEGANSEGRDNKKSFNISSFQHRLIMLYVMLSSKHRESYREDIHKLVDAPVGRCVHPRGEELTNIYYAFGKIYIS